MRKSRKSRKEEKEARTNAKCRRCIRSCKQGEDVAVLYCPQFKRIEEEEIKKELSG